jgi:hypothetical protein
VRVWEYDRRNSSVWQVDIFLSGGALFIHPKITNTLRATQLQGYWWTCVAVPVTPDTRVLAHAAFVAETSVEGSWLERILCVGHVLNLGRTRGIRSYAHAEVARDLVSCTRRFNPVHTVAKIRDRRQKRNVCGVQRARHRLFTANRQLFLGLHL